MKAGRKEAMETSPEHSSVKSLRSEVLLTKATEGEGVVSKAREAN